LGNGYQLFYNRTFSHGKGSGRSYSVSLRPDFSLMKGGQPLVVFDAKFRFDERDIQPSQPLEEEMDDAQQEGNIERLAKHADICKMHTYRDALKCRAAVVLFPGKEGDGIFYDKNEGKLECCVTLRALARHIIKGKSWEGVGALPLVPESKAQSWR
jgi:predicted component of viral defense system (DUF524 family)